MSDSQEDIDVSTEIENPTERASLLRKALLIGSLMAGTTIISMWAAWQAAQMTPYEPEMAATAVGMSVFALWFGWTGTKLPRPEARGRFR